MMLLEAWRWPSLLLRYTPAQLDLLLRQAEAAQLLAMLGARVARAGIDIHLPLAVRRRFDWAARHAARHAQSVRWEVRHLRQALAGLDTPLLLLKGAAYTMAGLPAADGRIFSDIDLLAPRARLPAVEAALMLHGWAGCGQDAYDQSYYRRWMHELPPMRHVRRGSVIDVHHDIAPPTAGARPAGAALRVAARVLAARVMPADERQSGLAALHVPAPPDLVLHCAAHLLSDSEFGSGLRNLADLDNLLADFGVEPGFWQQLALRAQELALAASLCHALRCASRLLGTRVPPGFMAQLGADTPSRAGSRTMDALLARALLPDHASCNSAAGRLARQVLYVRATWLRMPPWLLTRHLCHKAFITPWHRARDTP